MALIGSPRRSAIVPRASAPAAATAPHSRTLAIPRIGFPPRLIEGILTGRSKNLCTTEALRHGETQKIDELFWPSGTLGLFQCAVSLFQTSSHQQKAEDTEVLNLPPLACIRTMTQICAKKQEFRAW